MTYEQYEQDDLAGLLRRYLDNHCANSDAEGMSTLCECKLCLDTRAALRTEAKTKNERHQKAEQG